MTEQELTALIGDIRETHRSFKDYQLGQLRLNNQELSIVRRLTGCTKGKAPGILRSVFNGNGARICLIPRKQVPQQNGEAAAILARCTPFEHSKVALSESQKQAKKVLEKSVVLLPVYEWAEGIRGFGKLGLAQIIAETGDLSNYANPAKLWKRMGVGLVNGERQRCCRDKLKAEEHGYNPRRRAILWNIGECLIKLNKDGAYRTLYDERKEFERERVEAAGVEMSKMHIHRRAQRYMEKRLLVDLWKEWRSVHR